MLSHAFGSKPNEFIMSDLLLGSWCARLFHFLFYSLSLFCTFMRLRFIYFTQLQRSQETFSLIGKWINGLKKKTTTQPFDCHVKRAQVLLECFFSSSQFYLMWKLRESIECNKICVFHFISIHFSFCFVIHKTGRDQHQEFWFECSQRNEIKTIDLHARVKWCVKNTISAKLKEKYCNANMNWWWNYRQSVSQTKGVRIHRIHEFQFESSNGWRGEVEKKNPS